MINSQMQQFFAPQAPIAPNQIPQFGTAQPPPLPQAAPAAGQGDGKGGDAGSMIMTMIKTMLAGG